MSDSIDALLKDAAGRWTVAAISLRAKAEALRAEASQAPAVGVYAGPDPGRGRAFDDELARLEAEVRSLRIKSLDDPRVRRLNELSAQRLQMDQVAARAPSAGQELAAPYLKAAAEAEAEADQLDARAASARAGIYLSDPAAPPSAEDARVAGAAAKAGRVVAKPAARAESVGNRLAAAYGQPLSD